MVDTITMLSVVVAVAASGFGAMNWLEARKSRHLLQTTLEALPYLADKRDEPARSQSVSSSLTAVSPVSLAASTAQVPRARSAPRKRRVPATSTAFDIQRLTLKQQAEERRRLKLQLQQEREQWRQRKDIAKAIGWILDHIGNDVEDE